MNSICFAQIVLMMNDHNCFVCFESRVSQEQKRNLGNWQMLPVEDENFTILNVSNPHKQNSIYTTYLLCASSSMKIGRKKTIMKK